jgi:hypothetical protein
MGDRKGAYRVLVGRNKGKRPLGRTKRKGSIILKWISRKSDGAWAGLIWLGIGTACGLL